MSKTTLITIKESNSEMGLHILKTKLESEGIACYLKNEFTTQVMNYMPTFTVELQVSTKDMEKAVEIIKEMEGK